MCSICVPRQLFASWTSSSWKGVHPLSLVSRQPGFCHRLSCQQSSLSQSLLLVSAERQHLREIYKLANQVWNAPAKSEPLTLVFFRFASMRFENHNFWNPVFRTVSDESLFELSLMKWGKDSLAKLYGPEGSAHHSYTGVVCLFAHFDMRGHALFLGSLHISNLKSELDTTELYCAIEYIVFWIMQEGASAYFCRTEKK